MKFRFLMAALAVVLAGGLFAGSRSGTVSAATQGPDLTIQCPAVVVAGSNFSCIVGWNALTPGQTAPTGYQFVAIYNSVLSTPTAGTQMSVRTPTGVGFTKLYNPATMWESAPAAGDGAEFCPAPSAGTTNVSNVLLPPGYVGSAVGCVKTAGGPATQLPSDLYSFNFKVDAGACTAPAPCASTPVHLVTFGGGGATFGTYSINAGPQTNTILCKAPSNCVSTPFSTPDNLNDPIVTVILPPADVSVVKTASAASVVQGQTMSFTITGTNNTASTGVGGVTITDTFNAAFSGLSTLDPNCSFAGQVLTCNYAGLAGGASTTPVVVNATVSGGAGTTVANCANIAYPPQPLPEPNTTNNQSCVNVQVIPPAVAWSKVLDTPQVFLCEAGSIGTQGCTADGKNGTVSFEEVMTNQGDPNGMAAFEFTLHFDNLIFGPPTICGLNISICPATGSIVDLTDGVALLLAGGRTSVTCSMSIPQETQIHVACASTGPIGVGPVFIGARDIADVRLQIKDNVRGALFPHKENGIVTRVDDTGTEIANTCGQPLNDGTGFVVPGQTTECQGVPLQGILPGGLVADSHAFITIRRLEGDVTKDCSVTVADMQAEATRYGFGFGSLLYNIWYDLEPHTTGADGDIDIKDVQFVFGRFGSECFAPIPPQVPQQPVDP